MNNKRLSIITCVKSDVDHLFESWSSISPILNDNINWIIKYSHNCSVDFIKKIPSSDFIIKIISEDTGLYNALNQGLKACETEYYMVLGAGDKVTDNFDTISKVFDSKPKFDAYFFGLKISNLTQNRILLPSPGDLNTRMSCPHPSSILKTSVSKELGGFSEKYEIAADYDHLCKFSKITENIYFSNEIVVDFMGGGMSDERSFEGFIEEDLIRLRVFNSNIFAMQARLSSVISVQLSNLILNNFK
jgi:hypothetical protein